MSEKTDKPIWVRKTPEETQALYADWADTYDAEIAEWGYATPGRVATALAAHLPDRDAPILDFGCGTGLCGVELRKVGFSTVDGTDVSPEMIAHAGTRAVYRTHWVSEVGTLDVRQGDYAAITAAGVISLGAAPPETLDMVLDVLAPGGLVVLSYNDATLADAGFMDRLAEVQETGMAKLVWSEHGPHLPAKGLESTVFVLQRT